jgi:hypothetical protein
VYDSFTAFLQHLAKGTQDSSGVMGNYHAPFLGEGAAAMPPPYPTLLGWMLPATVIRVLTTFAGRRQILGGVFCVESSQKAKALCAAR